MKPRAPVALLVAAAMAVPAPAQETVTYSLSWIEVFAHTSIPVSNPNGLVEPGEGARVRLTTLVTPGIGASATYVPPPGPGTGTIAALAGVVFDLHQSNALGGGWGHIRIGVPNIIIENPGTSNPDGSYSGAVSVQFILPGISPIPTNPWPDFWQGTWTPSTYSPRETVFTSAGAAVGGNQSWVAIKYGEDPNQGGPLHVMRNFDGIFGDSGPIPIVPAPGAGVILGLGLLAATGRRR